MSYKDQVDVAISPILEAADAEVAALKAESAAKDETISALHDELALTVQERDAAIARVSELDAALLASQAEVARLKGVVVNKNATITDLRTKLKACRDGAGSFN